MAYQEPDLPALRASIQATFPDRWDQILAWLDESYDPDDGPHGSHYAWFGALVHAVLDPAIDAGDAQMCDRVLTFALPLHGGPGGDAVQHRVLRYTCRNAVARRLLPLLDPALAVELLRLCEATGDGQ